MNYRTRAPSYCQNGTSNSLLKAWFKVMVSSIDLGHTKIDRSWYLRFVLGNMYNTLVKSLKKSLKILKFSRKINKNRWI